MKAQTLERLAPLLAVLRASPALAEVRPAAFHLDGRDFLHFHDEADGLFADVRLTKGRVRLPVRLPVRLSVETRAEQAELLDRIEAQLSSLDTHVRAARRQR